MRGISLRSFNNKPPVTQTNPDYRTRVSTRLYYERAGIRKDQIPKPPEGFKAAFGVDWVTREPFAQFHGRFLSKDVTDARRRLGTWILENGWNHTQQL